MGGDMVTALGRAASGANTLFGHNSSRPADEPQALVRSPGRSFALGEKVRTQHLELSQARQTFTAVGTQGRGLWGFHHGANEHGVAAGCTGITTRLRGDGPGLTGPDLVRLALERGRTARQALDLVADLVCRHTAEGPGVALLLADPREAFLLEAGGPYWACQEVGEVRAVSEAGTIRQDWNTLARGFSSHALSQGWWPGDGSKLDFTAAVNPDHAGREPALRRWGRVTLLLEQQNGRIDAVFLRRLLGDHFEGCPDEVDPLADEGGPTPVCQHGNAGGRVTAASLVAVLPGGDAALPLAWWSFGPPCTAVYFPVFLDGELPEEFGWPVPGLGESVWERGRRLLRHVGSDADRWHLAREGMTRLQGAIDQKTEEFAAEAAAWKRRGERAELARSAGMFLRHLIEQFEEAVDGLLGVRPHAPRPWSPPHLAGARGIQAGGRG